jgi:hypothetical protein
MTGALMDSTIGQTRVQDCVSGAIDCAMIMRFCVPNAAENRPLPIEDVLCSHLPVSPAGMAVHIHRVLFGRNLAAELNASSICSPA